MKNMKEELSMDHLLNANRRKNFQWSIVLKNGLKRVVYLSRDFEVVYWFFGSNDTKLTSHVLGCYASLKCGQMQDGPQASLCVEISSIIYKKDIVHLNR